MASEVGRATSSRPPSLKCRLQAEANFRGYGAFLMSGSPLVAELMGSAGYDFLVVDMEHSPIDYAGALPMLQAAAAAGVPALLRVPLDREELIKKALDLGPAGIIVPLVSSACQAKDVVLRCRYPPVGCRGVANSLVRASAWGCDDAYLGSCEARCLVLCQVETVSAVEAVDEIISVDGVDGIFVGPMDLSAAYGHLGDLSHADVGAALKRVETAAAKHPGKVLAGFAGPRSPAEMFEAGYRLVACSADVALLRTAALADAQRGRQAAAESALGTRPPAKAAPASLRTAPAVQLVPAVPAAKKRPRE